MNIKKLLEGHPLVLPPHLRNWNGTGKPKPHTDYVWPLSKLSRAVNVLGPRVGIKNPGYAPWPPFLLEGKGVCRWETGNDSVNHRSVIYIPSLKDAHVFGSQVYGQEWFAREMNPAHPSFGKEFPVTLRWEEATVKDEKHPWFPGKFRQIVTPNNYSPSAVQEFSKKGWMKLRPDYYSAWNWFLDFKVGETPRGAFVRNGWRPDHEDEYYNYGPHLGVNGE